MIVHDEVTNEIALSADARPLRRRALPCCEVCAERDASLLVWMDRGVLGRELLLVATCAYCYLNRLCVTRLTAESVRASRLVRQLGQDVDWWPDVEPHAGRDDRQSAGGVCENETEDNETEDEDARPLDLRLVD